MTTTATRPGLLHQMKWIDNRGRDFNESVPDIWLAGFCQSNKCDVETALAYWRQQSEWGRDDDSVEVS